jgi:oligopeptide transport system permease protein
MNARADGLSLATEARGRSLWSDARRRLMRNRAAVTSGLLLILLALLVIVGPWFSPYAYDQTDWAMISVPPDLGSGHLFGTDSLGRDLFVRTLHGGRISLLVGVVATLVSLGIGVVWGATAGYVGGRVDHLMMRIVDILYAMPFMFFVILLMVFFGRNILLIFVAIGAINWLDMARIVRGQTLSLKEKEFVEAAEAMGVGGLDIIRRHIVPNLLGVVVVYVTLTIPQVILVESFLSFLGLGVQEPMTSWGALVNEGAQEMESAPWMLVVPALFLATTLFCFNFIGDGLRDALDPKDR